MKTHHKPASRLGRTTLAALLLLCTGGLSRAAQTLQYTFDNVVGTTVPNTAPGATINGTLTAGGGHPASIVPGPVVVVNGISYSLGNVVEFGNPTGFTNGNGN